MGENFNTLLVLYPKYEDSLFYILKKKNELGFKERNLDISYLEELLIGMKIMKPNNRRGKTEIKGFTKRMSSPPVL